MDPITAKLMSAAGAAADPVYVDDVFSTYLYDGDGTTSHTITNNIDINGEGGLVWVKNRSTAQTGHILVDTERGASRLLLSNSDVAEIDDTSFPSHIKSFSSTGFVVGDAGSCNDSGDEYCSWTFRKSPGFFDVVTYTGNGTGRNISHSLGSEPGSIWIKRTDSSESWTVYHRSLHPGGGGTAATEFFSKLELNSSGDQFGATKLWSPSASGGEAHTASTFYVHSHGSVNENGGTFVAYLFAHDDQSFGDAGNESIIKCGSFEGAAGTTVDLGFEPQWILVKRIDGAYNWNLYDNMRGLPGGSGLNAEYLEPNTSNSENDHRSIFITSTGFEVNTSAAYNTDTHVYIAIRRPHKPPETAAECFDVFEQVGASVTQLRPGTSGSSVTDLAWIKATNLSGGHWRAGARLTGNGSLRLNDNDPIETSVFGSTNVWDQMSGTEIQSDPDTSHPSYTYLNVHFARKPGFIDVVTYTGNGLLSSRDHGLGAVPEMIWVKRRNANDAWAVYHKALGSSNELTLNENYASTNNALFGGIDPIATVFYAKADNQVNGSGQTYVAYLFATLPGISKVGSYTGTGNNINVDCGFTNGARFVVIKRTDSADNWMVFNTASGINSGNEPYLRLNLSNAEVTGNDRLDPLNSGFTVGTGDFAINASGGSYIFLAIA